MEPIKITNTYPSSLALLALKQQTFLTNLIQPPVLQSRPSHLTMTLLQRGPTPVAPCHPPLLLSLVPSLDPNNPTKSFMLFPLLPADIRVKIWTLLVDNDAKVFEMKHPHYYQFDCGRKVSDEEVNEEKKKYADNKEDHRNLLGAC
jgi:hypothetical protein